MVGSGESMFKFEFWVNHLITSLTKQMPLLLTSSLGQPSHDDIIFSHFSNNYSNIRLSGLNFSPVNDIVNSYQNITVSTMTIKMINETHE